MTSPKSRDASHRFDKWGWLLPLLAVLILALLIRLINYTGVLDSDVLSYADRAYDVAHGQFQIPQNARDIDFRFALILPLGFLYFLFGPSELSTILYSLLASLAGITFVYGIGRLQANETAGLIAALIWAVFPLNVFLSTFFGPDEILATYTIAAVFFLLWGEKLQGRKMGIAYCLGLGFAILGVFVKPSAIIIFVFVILFFLLRLIRNYEKSVWHHFVGIKRSRRPIILAVGIFSVLTLGLVYLESQRSPFLFSFFRASWDLSNLFALGKTQEEFPIRGLILNTSLFLVSFPIFITAIAGVITKRLQNSTLLLVWAGSQFLYFEWGSISTNILIYSPLPAVANDRNVLFVFAPFAVVVGLLLAKALSETKARLVVFLSVLIVPPIAWSLKYAQFSGSSLSLVSLAVAAAIIGVMLIIPLLSRRIPKCQELVVSTWLITLLVAFLYPTPPLHISDEYWQRQVSYRNAIKSAVQFFAKHQDHPILALSLGNARELDFLSNFEFGHETLVTVTEPRIHVVPDPKSWFGSAYIYLRDEINQLHPVPGNWWKVAEFEAGQENPMVIFRVLSQEDAAIELAAAQRNAAMDSTTANLTRLFGAGINAGNVSKTVEAWSLLNQENPQGYPLSLIAPQISSKYQTNMLALSENLLSDDLRRYQLDDSLEGAVMIETTNSTSTLTIVLGEDLGVHFGVFDEVSLQPGSLYLFTIEVQSTTGVNLLRVANGDVSDSQDFNDIHGDWEQVVVIFFTPTWEEEEVVRIDLVTVNKKGYISIRSPQLFKVELE